MFTKKNVPSARWILFVLCALALGGCEADEEGTADTSLTNHDATSDTATSDAPSDTTTSDATGSDAPSDTSVPCTQDSQCPTPPGLSMCEDNIAVQNAPQGVCLEGTCGVEGGETRTDCTALGRVCQEGMCVEGHFGCPPEGSAIGGACDASQEGTVCNYGTECCCGQCYPSLVCTCSGGQFSCYASDACLIPGCPGDCGRDLDCPSDQVCDFTNGMCGAQGFADGKGQCIPKPTTCDAGGTGVCACDGSTPLNECEAQASGQDTARFGGCADGAGGFDCGGLLSCDAASYCAISMNDTPGPEYFADCAPLPPECDVTAPACGCLPPNTFSTCNDSTGHIVVVYPGG